MVMDVDFERETVCFAYIIQYREIDDKQFFIEIDRLLPVYRLNVDRAPVLDECL